MKESKIFLRTNTVIAATLLWAASIPVTGFWGSLVTIGYGLSIYFLQLTYQKQDAVGRVFYSFLFLGLSSTICLQSLVFVPFLWFMMARHFSSFSIRTLSASLLGILAPYWFITPFFMLSGKAGVLVTHLETITTDLQIPDYMHLELWGVVLYLVVVVVNIVCALYYTTSDTGENTRQRLTVQAFLIIFHVAAIVPIVQPQLLPYFIGMMTMGESMLIATTVERIRIRIKS